MSTVLALGLASVPEPSQAPERKERAAVRRTRRRHFTPLVASLSLVLVLVVPPLLGSFLDDGRALGIGPDELRVATTLLVVAGVFFMGFLTRITKRAGSLEEPIDVDEIVDTFREFEENDSRLRQERQTLYYDEFHFRDEDSAPTLRQHPEVGEPRSGVGSWPSGGAKRNPGSETPQGQARDAA